MPENKYSISRIIVAILMLAAGVIMIIPVLWMLITSLKTKGQVYSPNWIPAPFTLENYVSVFDKIPVASMIGNSMIVSLISTFFQLFIGTMAAYAFARIRFVGRNVLFTIFLGTMMIPAYILTIPLYLIIDGLGLIDTLAALILPRLVSVFAIFMLRQFFYSIPQELDESAFIDGASRFRVLFQIIVPLSKPAYAALFIFSFMNMWNDFMWPLIATNSETMRTIQVGIAYFKDANTIDYGATMAASLLASIPILIVFLCANRSFVQGITMTGIKG